MVQSDMKKTPGRNVDGDEEHLAMATEPGVRLGAQERRVQLLATARAVFGEHGFNSTSMNDVAEAAGVTKPVLYQHFASKHELFHQLLIETSTELSGRLQQVVEGSPSPREKVERGTVSYTHLTLPTNREV